MAANRPELGAAMQDELLRAKIRDEVDKVKAAEPKSVLRHPLAPAIVGFILTGIVGLALSTWVASWQKRQDQAARDREAAQRLRDGLTLGLAGFSEHISERRVRAVLLYNALKRGAPLPEISLRKEAYDEAYAEWEKHLRSNMFMLRQAQGKVTYSAFESDVQYKLKPLLTTVDECLTQGYDDRVLRKKDPEPQLTSCMLGGGTKSATLAVLDCSSAITNRVYASLHGSTCTDGDCDIKRCDFPVRN